MNIVRNPIEIQEKSDPTLVRPSLGKQKRRTQLDKDRHKIRMRSCTNQVNRKNRHI